jgi:hypothetical protein
MECRDYTYIDNLQNEIEPILNELLSSSTDLKVILQKYGVLEGTEFQLKLNLNKLKIQEAELMRIDGARPKIRIKKRLFQEINIYGSEYCPSCGCYVNFGTCPD